MTTRYRFSLLATMCTAVSLSACSESAAVQEDRFANVEIEVEELAPGVAVLFGAGGNIGLSYGEDGNVLIDDQYAPLTDKIGTAIDGLHEGGVRFLLNTHWHGDHSGGNENFGETGALIMAHDNVRLRMAGEQASGNGNEPSSPDVALPVVTYADGITLHLNGDDLKVVHIANGHTDGDSMIYWEQANVLHMGDLFFHEVTLPFIDLKSGGNANGILAGAQAALEMVDGDTKIIPGHGPVADRDDLIAYRDMMKTMIDQVGTAKAQGKSLEQVQAMKPAAKWDTNPDAFIKGDAFVASVYNSL